MKFFLFPALVLGFLWWTDIHIFGYPAYLFVVPMIGISARKRLGKKP